MLNKYKKVLRFFVPHFIIIIPIMLTSILATNVISYSLMQQENVLASQQLESVAAKLQEKIARYKEESLVIGYRSELSADKMIDNPTEARKGIDVLNLKNFFDKDIYGVFLSYGNGKIYASTGIGDSRNYFTNRLTCLEESVQRGLESIESKEDSVKLLFVNENSGWLMYSYHTNLKENMSVHFLVYFSQLKEDFSPRSQGEYYELVMKDGSRLILGQNKYGEEQVIPQTEWELLLQNSNYKMLEEGIGDSGIMIRFYYDEKSLITAGWLNMLQLVNILLIVIGVALSAVLSWILSEKKIKEINLLKAAVQGKADTSLPEKHVYGDLYHAILDGLDEKQKLEKSVMEYNSELKSKTAHMIFNGVYKDYDKLRLVFQQLGFSGCPERFFIGAANVERELLPEQVPPILQGSLIVYENRNGQQTMLFLHELTLTDESRMQRKSIAADIRDYLYQKGIRAVRIGMSQVYENPMLIDCAYNEAVNLLEDILAGKMKDFCVCWDDVSQQSFGVLFEEKLVEAFEHSLQEHDFEEAVQCFSKLMRDSSVRECSAQNRLYLRYEILQHLVSYLSKEDMPENVILLGNCLNINVEREKEFVNTVMNILQRFASKKEDDNFKKMLDYINENYQNSDLTYEDVADVGGISKTYISRIFRAKLGVSYIEYLTTLRLERACTLLRTTDMNVSAIAETIGYVNAASFRRVFREKYGISASDYRKKEQAYRNENQEN